jgi:hypothetical protein
MRGGSCASILFGVGAVLLPACAAEAASKTKPQISVESVKQAIEGKTGSVQVVTFPDTGWSAVKVVRGKAGRKSAAEKVETAEIVTFADARSGPVRILRGDSERKFGTPDRLRSAPAMTMQLVTFANLRDRPVSVLRGSGFQNTTETDLFGPASAADLDRVAFAVDGAESSHGADLRMWRPEPSGPQGPMQVTAAAAFDVGGGDRFDLGENRALGRAYLARMYRRYGNWPDAIAAYNWGPGNVDAWIGGGRAPDKLPLGVERYRNRVLRETALAGPGILTASTSSTGSIPQNSSTAGFSAPTITIDAAAVVNLLQRGTATAEAALHRFTAALRDRAADWKSNYAGLAGRIVSLAKMPAPPAPAFESEYAGSPESAD